MDGGDGEGGGEEGRRRPWGKVDNDDNDDNDDDDGLSPRMRHCRPLADVRGDDGTIGGPLEAHHK